MRYSRHPSGERVAPEPATDLPHHRPRPVGRQEIMKPAPLWRRLLFVPGAGEALQRFGLRRRARATGGACVKPRGSQVPRNGGTPNAGAASRVTLVSALDPGRNFARHDRPAPPLPRPRDRPRRPGHLGRGRVRHCAQRRPHVGPDGRPAHRGAHRHADGVARRGQGQGTRTRSEKPPRRRRHPRPPRPRTRRESRLGHPRRARVGGRPDGDPRGLRQPRRVRLLRRPHGRDPGDGRPGRR